MTNGRIEVITSVQRRRRWPRAEKERIVAASLEAGAIASEVARAAGIHTSQLYRWRRDLCGRADGTRVCRCDDCAGIGPAGQRCRHDGDRVRLWSTCADYWRGRACNGLGGGHGSGERAAMTIPIPSGTRVWLATGHTDMRKGFDSLALLVQETLRRDPHNGHLFVSRGRRGSLIKVLWHDGQGLCLYAKRLERGRFIWPSPADGTVAITPAQLGYLLEGIDWRNPDRTCKRRAELLLAARDLGSRAPRFVLQSLRAARS